MILQGLFSAFLDNANSLFYNFVILVNRPLSRGTFLVDMPEKGRIAYDEFKRSAADL